MYDTARRSGGVVSQVCPWCQQEKPAGEFWRNPETGWITKECRACAQERERLWAAVAAKPVVFGRRRVDADPATPLLCKRCGRTRPRSLFYTFDDGTGRRYFRPQCKQCMLAAQNARPRSARRSDQGRRTDRDRWLRKQYGIGVEDYERRLEEQAGRCAICRTDDPGGPTPMSAFHVDHCHETRVVRGLLCRSCNTAIGLLKEDPQLLAAAAAYLDGGAVAGAAPGRVLSP